MDAETLARIRSVKRGVSGDIQRKGRRIRQAGNLALIQAANSIRTRYEAVVIPAIVLMFCGTGLRAGNWLNLERRDYANGIPTVRGKGRGANTVKPRADAVDKAIRVWLKVGRRRGLTVRCSGANSA